MNYPVVIMRITYGTVPVIISNQIKPVGTQIKKNQIMRSNSNNKFKIHRNWKIKILHRRPTTGPKL